MPKKYFTYKVTVFFETQFTFSESAVEQSDEGGQGDMFPTVKALDALGREIEQCLSQQFPIANIDVWADFDDLLGVEEE